jgi:LysR family glycine cleavage system transcriptional activator
MRVSVLPSFAQRWLVPRIRHWREQHPDIAIELHASQQVVDLQREGFHAALRQGNGVWRGLRAERLIDSPRVPVGSPQAAQRLLGQNAGALAHEPLLGSTAMWERWFALSGLKVRVNPVASFNDAGLMLQAAEQNLGIALAREVLAADALRERRLIRLSTLALPEDSVDAYWLVYPDALHEWPPLQALRSWLHAQLEQSRRAWAAADVSPLKVATGTAAAGRTGSRNRVRSAKSAPGRAR